MAADPVRGSRGEVQQLALQQSAGGMVITTLPRDSESLNGHDGGGLLLIGFRVQRSTF